MIEFAANVKESLFFGYEPKTMLNGRAILFATPEKALLDLLYLNPFYKTEQDMEELRLDEDFMQSEFNMDCLGDFLSRIGNKALEKRVKCLLKVYEL